MTDAAQRTAESTSQPDASAADADARALWFGVLAGPAAWGLPLLVGYALVSLHCTFGAFGARLLGFSVLDLLLFALTALTVALTGAGAVVAHRRWRRFGGGALLAHDRTQPPGRFMALTGLASSAVFLLAIALQAEGVQAVSYTGWQVPVETDSSYTKARIQRIDDSRVRADLDAGKVVIIAGFQGIDGDGHITTLGRGGSDTSAVAVAAAMKAAVEAGRLAYRAGRMARRMYADPSSPLAGLI